MQSPAVTIVEVGPRDGLQNVQKQVSTDVKIDLIRRLYDTGLKQIELTSIVSPKAVPQLADGPALLGHPPIQALLHDSTLTLPVLVANRQAAIRAAEKGVRNVAVFISASEGFSKANIRCSCREGLERAAAVAKEARARGMGVRGYVSCIFVDPFDGPTAPEAVLKTVQGLLEMGCYEVSLGDTLGVGTPTDVHRLVVYLLENGIPVQKLAGHFHDTYGQALANVWEAYGLGLRTFDSSVSGLGGCPFAPGAQGNVATEDLVYMFAQAGIATGVDLPKLAAIGSWISGCLSRSTGSRVGAALMAKATKTSKPALIPCTPVPISKTSSAPSPTATESRSDPTWTLTQQTDGLLVHQRGVNLRITMNRPDNGNALTTTMINDIVEILSRTAKDTSLHRVVFTGSGKYFCTGMDLGRDSTPVAAGNSATEQQLQRLTRLLTAIESSPKVTIAAVNGPAFGGGVGLAFASDLRLCTSAANFTLSEAKLGLCPATISPYIVREWGVPLAREAMLTARAVTPTELHARGVITGVVNDATNLANTVDMFLTKLKAVSSDASHMCKSLVQVAWSDGGQEKQKQVVRELFYEMMQPNGSGAYGVKKFQQRERIDWDSYQPEQAKSSKL